MTLLHVATHLSLEFRTAPQNHVNGVHLNSTAVHGLPSQLTQPSTYTSENLFLNIPPLIIITPQPNNPGKLPPVQSIKVFHQVNPKSVVEKGWPNVGPSRFPEPLKKKRCPARSFFTPPHSILLNPSPALACLVNYHPPPRPPPSINFFPPSCAFHSFDNPPQTRPAS